MAEKKKKAAEGAPVSVAKEVPPVLRKSTKVPKLAKKNKSRLPRRQKKAQKKALEKAENTPSAGLA